MKQIRKYENGRSMVEMLGVLAIIGVLSIGGVMGYSYAMDKSRANRACNDIRLRAVTLQTQNAMGRDPDLSEYSGMNTVYDIRVATAEELPAGYGMVVSNVPQRVCEMIYASTQGWATVKINGTNADSADSCDETNNMIFAFNPDGEVAAGNSGNNDNITEEFASSDHTEASASDESLEASISDDLFEASVSNSDTSATPVEELNICTACIPIDAESGSCQDNYYMLEGLCYQCPQEVTGVQSCDNDGLKCQVGFYNYAGKCVSATSCQSNQISCGGKCCNTNQICTSVDWSDSYCWTPQCDNDSQCSSDQICDLDTKQCIKKGNCQSSNDCSPNNFCHLDTSVNNGTSAFKPKTGYCEPIGTIHESYNLISGTSYLDWWSAENWCQANSAKLATLKDLGIVGGYGYNVNGYCSGNECIGADWGQLAQVLNNGSYYWTNTFRGPYPYEISAEYADAAAVYTRTSRHFPVCKK